jgi:hypothetical protein
LVCANSFIPDLGFNYLFFLKTYFGQEWIQEVFTKISLDGGTMVAVEPKPAYAPLFADLLTQKLVGYCETESPRSPPATVLEV